MRIWVHIFHTLSGAPFVNRQRSDVSVGYLLMENANLLTELKSNLISRSYWFFMTGYRSRVTTISSTAWKNFIKADSEASPMVGTSNQSMCFIFYYHSFRNSSSFILFYSGSRCLSSLMRCCSVSGADLSNMATEQTTAHSCKALNPGSVRLY